MKAIVIQSCPGFEEWREVARRCLCQGYAPAQLVWQDRESEAQNLFQEAVQHTVQPDNMYVPREFIDLASLAACHQSSDRFALLYRILWRLCHENRHLLKYKTDDDILKLNAYVKAVRRDAYKIKAFLRFREITHEGQPLFVAWYEPEHYSLALSLPFFQTRFKNMNWTILTPYCAAHWDRQHLSLSGTPDAGLYPERDEVEQYWLKYYASTFNPARPKKSAMLNQMPKKYWKNMPETVLIPDLLQKSEMRARAMIQKGRGGK